MIELTLQKLVNAANHNVTMENGRPVGALGRLVQAKKLPLASWRNRGLAEESDKVLRDFYQQHGKLIDEKAEDLDKVVADLLCEKVTLQNCAKLSPADIVSSDLFDADWGVLDDFVGE